MKIELHQTAPVFPVRSVKEALTWYFESLGLEATYINRHEGDETGDRWNYALLKKIISRSI